MDLGFIYFVYLLTRGSAAGCARRPNPCLLAKTVGSGIFQFSYYLIAISANAGCMDLGFIVGGQRTLVKQGNIHLRPRGTKDRLLKASLDGSVIVVGRL